MMNSIFLTTAALGTGSGGGSVSQHELNALKSKTNVLAVLEAKDLDPVAHEMEFNPFLQDYLALEKTRNLPFPEIIFTNGNPFGVTVDSFRAGDTVTIADCPAHELKESISEYEAVTGMNYRQQYPHMVNPFLWKMYIRHLEQAQVIITPSEYSVNALKKLGDFGKKDFRVIPHGCSPPATVSPYPTSFRIGHAGVFGTDKGQLYLISAWSVLDYKDAECVVAGKGGEFFKQQVSAMQKASKSTGIYRILGYVPDIDVLYRNISVYVQPSVTEGFGIEVIEAMSHGRPVICSDGAGASELVKHGENGFVFPRKNTDKLAEYIRYYKENPSEIAKHGARARETALDHTWDAVEKRIGEVIE